MTMLRSWLAPENIDWFRAHHFQRAPLARPDLARSIAEAFTWRTLNQILGAEPAPDLLCVARGKTVDVPLPQSLHEAAALFERGTGFVIRRSETRSPLLAALAAAFVQDFPGELNIQIFATPGGTHGFGWHYDFEDVFIVQTAGMKDYYFRRNTVDPACPRDGRPDFSKVSGETSPIATARLLPGDWLYLPARWWHVALCRETSLSLSLGIFPEL